MKTATDEITLSHSSANLLRGCEQKYVYYKVDKVAKDIDFDDNQEHFVVGKAVHQILEEMLHTWNEKEFYEWLDKVVAGYEISHQKHLIAALSFKLFMLNKKSGLGCVHAEFKIQTKHVLGYVDIIMADSEGNWWIVDIKTTARESSLTNNKLHNDYQLNLYAAHYKLIAKDLGLDAAKFMGCRYRVVTKTKARPKVNETVLQYIKRTKDVIHAFDVIIPKEDMDPDRILKQHRELWRRASKLHEGSKPKCDYAQCSSYFRPCEYWSRCHGELYTHSDKRFEVLRC